MEQVDERAVSPLGGVTRRLTEAGMLDPPPLAVIERRARRRTARRRTAASVATVAALAGVVGLARVRPGGELQAGDAPGGSVPAGPVCRSAYAAADLRIFMAPGATEDERAAVQAWLEQDPRVDEVSFTDRNQAYEQYRQLFGDRPEMLAAVTPEVLPTSFGVELDEGDGEAEGRVRAHAERQPGVRSVVDQPVCDRVDPAPPPSEHDFGAPFRNVPAGSTRWLVEVDPAITPDQHGALRAFLRGSPDVTNVVDAPGGPVRDDELARCRGEHPELGPLTAPADLAPFVAFDLSHAAIGDLRERIYDQPGVRDVIMASRYPRSASPQPWALRDCVIEHRADG